MRVFAAVIALKAVALEVPSYKEKRDILVPCLNAFSIASSTASPT